jgi:hypothetical protein
MMFAAAVGRAICVLALWRLERGDRSGNLDQLFGSTSVFQTIMTQINLRAYGWLGFALAALWILSPFGGQASLRIVESGDSQNTSLINLEYLACSIYSDIHSQLMLSRLACISHVPVLAMNTSTLLRETTHANTPLGGLTLDDDERGRLLKDIQIRLGDLAASENIGKIGIG